MPISTHLESVQMVLLVLFVGIALVAGAARRFAVSYPIVLVITGLVVSFIPHLPRVPLPPDVVFLIFLPPLLFAAAWQTSWADFRYNIVSIGMLAVGLVFFTAVGVALLAHFFLPEFDWRAGFLLGAIVSPTDAVAASSIAKKIGMPRRIVDILEGESLINDATGLLALGFGLDMIVTGTTPTVAEGVIKLVWLFGGGLGVGLVLGAVVVWFEKWVDDGPVEIVISLIVPYAAYLLGEAVHASGIIAVVVAGLYLSRKSATFFSADVRLQASAVWESLEFLLNGLVFILLGLQLPYVLAGIRNYSHARIIVYGTAFSLAVIGLRLLWMYPGTLTANFIRRRILRQNESMPPLARIFLVGWTGMRGVVALAAASALPYTLASGAEFAQRNLIIFLTFCVIFTSLVLQGLTLPAVVRGLGLVETGLSDCDESEARRILVQVAIAHLQSTRPQDNHMLEHAYDDLLHQYEHRLEIVADCDPTGDPVHTQRYALASTLLDTVKAEREALISLRDEGRVDDASYRTIERELDLEQARYGKAV